MTEFKRSGGNHFKTSSDARGRTREVSTSRVQPSVAATPMVKASPANVKRNLLGRNISIALMVIGVVLLVVAGLIMFNKWQDDNAANEEYAAYKQYVVPAAQQPTEGGTVFPVVDWAALQAVNQDIVGWLQVPNTQIDYPVIQGRDNDQYLRTTPEGETRTAGSIFMDYESKSDISDFHTIIYGHNMNNGSMFHDIVSYTDKTYFDEHKTLYYITPTKGYVLEPIATYVTDGSDTSVRVFGFADLAGMHAYLNELVSKSVVVADGFDLSTVNHAFILSTCSYDRQDGRTILICNVKEVQDIVAPQPVEQPAEAA